MDNRSRVGGTFSPVEVEDLSKHKMDSEEAFVKNNAVETINKAKSEKRKVCAVGTTVMRVLESSKRERNLFDIRGIPF